MKKGNVLRWLQCIFLVCSIDFSHSIDVCSDILNGNAEQYSLDLINSCASGVANSDLQNTNCHDVDCSGSECLFGFSKDQFGCLTCDCAADGGEDLFEADIVLTDATKNFLRRNMDRRVRGRSRRDLTRNLPLWNQNKRGNNYLVPYYISSSIGQNGRNAIAQAAADFARYSCIRLVPRSNQNQYLNFYNGGGCFSPVGRTQRQQSISLGAGCWYKGTVMHEVLHSLGFWHEQSRPDRDSHVRINWQNIPTNLAYNFNKLTTSQVDSRGSAYDIGSVMHYGSSAFSSNGRPTITDLRGNRLRTQRSGFSQSDIQQLNILYGCQTTGTGTGTSTGTGGGDCEDKNASCDYWAGIGECTKNPGYMLPNCCKSCKAKETTETGTGTDGGDCENKNKYCNHWAKAGECTNNPGYMLPNCCKSCKAAKTKQTGNGGDDCEDKNGSCDHWARVGECTKNPGYMLPNCCKSCKATKRAGGDDCENKHRLCEVWARHGECRNNPGYMLPNCCRSCQAT